MLLWQYHEISKQTFDSNCFTRALRLLSMSQVGLFRAPGRTLCSIKVVL